MNSILDIVGIAIDLYFYAVLAWVILSWIPTSSEHVLGKLRLFLDRIIYPVILPIRRVVPAIRIGGGALDLSPIILLIGLRVLGGLI